MPNGPVSPSPTIEPLEAARLLAEEMQRRLDGRPITDDELAVRFPGREDGVRALLSTLDRVEQARLDADEDLDAFEDLLSTVDLSLEGYDLLHPIGAGGQGVVFKARRVDPRGQPPGDGEPLAIKFLRPAVLGDEAARRRFRQEAATLAEVEHPAVVKVVEFGETEQGIPYLVMPFVRGRHLSVRRTSSIPERLRLFVAVARGVQAAHERGIVHRDLKPANIRIDDAGRPRILDFGLAIDARAPAARRSLVATGKALGTPAWSSYEQLRGDAAVTPASDVFSLGVILHQLLADGNFPPHLAEQFRLTLEPVVEAGGTPSPPRELAVSRDVRADLRQIIQRCLRVDPGQRYQTAGELADAVERQVDYRPPSPRRRVAGLALAAVAVAGLALSAWRPWEQPRQIDRALKPVNGREMVTVLGGRFVWIPPGDFMLGAAADEPSSHHDERPPRPARVQRGFYLLQTEVPQRIFQDVMGYNPSAFVDPNRPVERVNYGEAVEFCRRASERTGRRIRLPTEVEWEYACRAGATTPWFFGGEPKLFIRYGNIADRSAAAKHGVEGYMDWDDAHAGTAPCGSYGVSRWSTFDMLGNVWEWCQGPYQIDPLDPATAVEGRAGARGGSWWDLPGTARSAHRNPLELSAKASTLGFRVVMEE